MWNFFGNKAEVVPAAEPGLAAEAAAARNMAVLAAGDDEAMGDEVEEEQLEVQEVAGQQLVMPSLADIGRMAKRLDKKQADPTKDLSCGHIAHDREMTVRTAQDLARMIWEHKEDAGEWTLNQALWARDVFSRAGVGTPDFLLALEGVTAKEPLTAAHKHDDYFVFGAFVTSKRRAEMFQNYVVAMEGKAWEHVEAGRVCVLHANFIQLVRAWNKAMVALRRNMVAVPEELRRQMAWHTGEVFSDSDSDSDSVSEEDSGSEADSSSEWEGEEGSDMETEELESKTVSP